MPHKSKKIVRLACNPLDPSDPGPLCGPDGSKISKKIYAASREGQSIEDYRRMLRRMDSSMFNGLSGEAMPEKKIYLHIKL